MSTLLSLVIFIAIAYFSGQFFQRMQVRQFWLRGIIFSGSLYILLGYLFGPQVFALIQPQVISDLNIAYSFFLGWVGFLIGLQLNLKSLLRFSRQYYWFSLTNFIIALITSLVLFYLVFSYLNFEMLDVFVLAVAGVVTSPILIGVFIRDTKARGQVTHILQFNAAIDNILGVIVMGIILGIQGEIKFMDIYVYGYFNIFIYVMVIVSASLIFYYLIKQFNTDEELLLLILGLILVVVGGAFYLKQSLVFASFVFGAIIANLDIPTKKLYLYIQKLEQPLYIILLIFTGMLLNIRQGFNVWLILIFLAVHIIAKFIAGYSATHVISGMRKIPSSIGLANLGMGGLSLVIILDFHISTNSIFSETMLMIIAFAILLNDIIGFWYLEGVLLKRMKKVYDT
ncbi:MAG: hypothetical protein GF313_07225 [Caldithrix sp.]|nr:hypothetical protein [Caldithrix sp.]